MAKDSKKTDFPNKNGKCHHYTKYGFPCLGKRVRYVGKRAECTTCGLTVYSISPGNRRRTPQKEFCPKYRVYKGKCPCCEKP